MSEINTRNYKYRNCIKFSDLINDRLEEKTAGKRVVEVCRTGLIKIIREWRHEAEIITASEIVHRKNLRLRNKIEKIKYYEKICDMKWYKRIFYIVFKPHKYIKFDF